MSKRPDARQMDLLTWEPPSAAVIVHPAKWRAIWLPIVDEIATAVIDEPERASIYLANVPSLLRGDLIKAGATEREASREVGLYQQRLHAELARRRHAERQGPGAA